MTSIFTRFTELDPVLFKQQVEASVGSPVFDAFSMLDPQHMLRQAAAALGGTLTSAALLDPARALEELDALATGGGGGYVAKAITLQGREGFFNNAISGAASSSSGTFFMWHRSSDSSGNNLSLITSALSVSGGFPSGNTPVNFYQGAPGFPTDTTFPFVVQLEDNPFSAGHFGVAPDVNINDGTWRLSACSWETNHDTGQKVCQVLLGSVLQNSLVVWEDSGPFSVDWGPALVVGAYTWSGSYFDESWIGDLSDCFLDITTGVDLSDPAVVAKIISGGKPVDQGSDGSLLTGSRPMIYCRGDKSTYGNNLGYGGTFTLFDTRNGTLFPNAVGPRSFTLDWTIAGMVVASVRDETSNTDVTAQFEPTISVDSGIAQISSTDFSADGGHQLTAIVHLLTDAATSPSD